VSLCPDRGTWTVWCLNEGAALGRERGATAGETFNKAGKTDILMRHEKHNMPSAEESRFN